MKTQLATVFFLIICCHLYAQQDVKLPGTVVEQNSQFNTGKVNFLSNAQIKSPGANPQLSDANGRFTLVFPDKPFGNVATIYVSRSGYETVNAEELKKAAVLGRTVPLKIVMCRQGQLYENQVAYYKIARDAALASYKKRVDILEKEGGEKDRLIAEMQVEFNQEINTAVQAKELLSKQLEVTEQRAQELADKFVTVNLDDQSESYQRAFRAFLVEDIDGALRILDSVDLKYRLATNTAEKEKEEALIEEMQESVANRNEQIAQDVNQCVFKARLHILKYEFGEAEKMYDLALQYAPEDEELMFEFAYFLAKQNRSKKAVQLFENALKKYMTLAVDNPERFERNVAMTQNNLGILYKDLNACESAKVAYQEALEIYRRLAQDNPERFEPDIAMTQSNLGNMYVDQKAYQAAEAAFKEALSIRKRLALDNPERFEPDVAMTQNNLGILYQDLNAYESAKEAYQEALEIYRRLAQDNPERFDSEVATTQNNLGTLYKDLNAFKAAEAAYQEALEIRKRLAKENPGRFEPDVADTQHNLGVLYRALNAYGAAEEAYQESLGIYQHLAKENPERFEPDVAMVQNSLGILYRTLNANEAAEAAFKQALDIYQSLARDNPERYNLNLANVLKNMGYLHKGLLEQNLDFAYQSSGLAYAKQAEAALSIYSTNIPIVKNYSHLIAELILYFENVTEEDPLVQAQINKALSLEKKNETETDPAQKAANQAEVVSILENLWHQYPNNAIIIPKLAEAYGTLAWYQLFNRHFVETEQAARKGIAVDPSQEWINTNLAPSLLFQGKYEEAKGLYVTFKERSFNETMKFKSAFLQDLADLEAAGITHPDVEKIRQLLQE